MYLLISCIELRSYGHLPTSDTGHVEVKIDHAWVVPGFPDIFYRISSQSPVYPRKRYIMGSPMR